MKKLIIDLVKKNSIFRWFVRGTYRLVNKIKYCFFKYYYRVDTKLIFFESYNGKSYSCSPKAIYEKMLTMKEFSNYKFVWAFNNPDNHKIKEDIRSKTVKKNTYDYYKYFSSSKYWIVNSMIEDFITKKKGQIYVQCWHGTPLKKLRCDIETQGSVMNNLKDIKRRNNIDAKRYDYFISSSRFSTEKFLSAFNLVKLKKDNIIIEKGYPRNDYLFNRSSSDIKNIKHKLGLPNDKKIILYAPTFRDNQHISGIGYTYKPELDFDSLKKRFGEQYIFLYRTHYFIANSFDFNKYKGFIFNVSNYDDINDLYLISDIIITDYSSVFFDYAILKKPIIFYMRMNGERGH